MNPQQWFDNWLIGLSVVVGMLVCTFGVLLYQNGDAKLRLDALEERAGITDNGTQKISDQTNDRSHRESNRSSEQAVKQLKLQLDSLEKELREQRWRLIALEGKVQHIENRIQTQEFKATLPTK